MKNIALTTVILAMTAGCTGPIGGEQPEMGVAFRQQLQWQQVNPGYASPEPVTGLNGELADNLMKEYREGGEQAEASEESQLQ
jgi:hypothetical protein